MTYDGITMGDLAYSSAQGNKASLESLWLYVYDLEYSLKQSGVEIVKSPQRLQAEKREQDQIAERKKYEEELIEKQAAIEEEIFERTGLDFYEFRKWFMPGNNVVMPKDVSRENIIDLLNKMQQAQWSLSESQYQYKRGW